VRRAVVLAGILFAIAALVPAAQARIVYVRHAAGSHPEVWTANDRGRHRHRIGDAAQAAITGDGDRVALLAHGARADVVSIARADGSGRARRVVRSRGGVTAAEFSPDGTRLGVRLSRRLAIYDTATRREVASLRGPVSGFSFSPDSGSIVYGRVTGDDLDRRADLFTAVVGAAPVRLTSDGRAAAPVWGSDGTIVYDRLSRRGTAQLWALDPGAIGPRQITRMLIPRRMAGLVPVELAGDRLAANFAGPDAAFGYTVNVATGRIRPLSRRLQAGFVAWDLSSDGSTVLGTTGGPDPGGRHDVVTVPFRGGQAQVLIQRAFSPRWSD
jgi:hypothetical protein